MYDYIKLSCTYLKCAMNALAIRIHSMVLLHTCTGLQYYEHFTVIANKMQSISYWENYSWKQHFDRWLRRLRPFYNTLNPQYLCVLVFITFFIMLTKRYLFFFFFKQLVYIIQKLLSSVVCCTYKILIGISHHT